MGFTWGTGQLPRKYSDVVKMGNLGENRYAVLLSDDESTISDITIDDVSDHSLLITRSCLNRINKVHWEESNGSEKNSGNNNVHRSRSDLTTIHSNEWSGRENANESIDENEH